MGIRVRFFEILIVTCLLVFCMTLAGCRSPTKEINTIKAVIPEAIEFIERNKDFFDLLQDIQKRIREFNETASGALIEDSSAAINRYIMSIHRDEFYIMVYCDDKEYNQKNTNIGDKYNLVTAKERQVIEDKVREIRIDEYQRAIRIMPDSIVVEYKQYEWAFLFIESPSLEHENIAARPMEHDSRIKVTDDWCIRTLWLQKN